MTFENSYADVAYAAAYAKLEFPGTYYLAYRDLPALFAKHVTGQVALDFGCGAGRSTRFLAKLGFDAVGVDIAQEMVREALAIDPANEYHVVGDGNLSRFADDIFDLVFAAFTFDNIATREKKVALFAELARVIRPTGRIVTLVSSPDIYRNEWASFSTKDFPENRQAKCGDVVRIIVTALADKRPVEDILWPDADYRDVYRQASLSVVDVLKPLGKPEDPCEWVNEMTLSPWVIYVLAKGKETRGRAG